MEYLFCYRQEFELFSHISTNQKLRSPIKSLRNYFPKSLIKVCQLWRVKTKAFRLRSTGSVKQPMSDCLRCLIALLSYPAGVESCLLVFRCLILWRHWLEQWLRHTSPFLVFFVIVEVARAVKEEGPANVDDAIVNGSITSGVISCGESIETRCFCG